MKKNERKSARWGKRETSLQTEASHYILKTSIFFFLFLSVLVGVVVIFLFFVPCCWAFVVLFAYYYTKTLNQVFILVNAQQQRIRYTHKHLNTYVHIPTYVSKRLVLHAYGVHDNLFISLIFYAVEKFFNFFALTWNTKHFANHLWKVFHSITIEEYPDKCVYVPRRNPSHGTSECLILLISFVSSEMNCERENLSVNEIQMELKMRKARLYLATDGNTHTSAGFEELRRSLNMMHSK